MACSAHLLEMPKRKGKRRGPGADQIRPPRGKTRTPAGADVWGVKEVESESDDELVSEQLEGLEAKDMEMISRMGL